MKGQIVVAVALGLLPLFADIAVDGKIPAGNIIVEGVEGATVRLRQDMRDSNDWFYWAFRVTGAEGKTLKFLFTDPYAGGPVSCRGPVVTKDGGKTWGYPCDGKAKENEFTYAFAADEKEVWFYQTFQYYPWQWDEFLKRHEADRGKVFEAGVLCKSRKGRDVPKAVFGRIDGKARYRVWLSSRTHCGEAPATYVLEGWLERVFGKDALGAWLRENVEFMVVPFVDYDGVVDGDQGKGRKPHDHNRDYTEFLYPESKAIADWITERAKCRIDVAFDHHSPWVRNVYNEKIYQTYHADEWNTAAKRKWGGFVMKHQDGSLDYSTADDFPWGFGWNSPKNTANPKPGEKPLKGLGGWIGDNVTNLLINSTYEIPFANAKGNVVTPEKCRAFGNASAVALRDFLETMRPVTRVDVYANSFREGGWKLDVQFMDVMGSPYLLAHGLGSPVPDAKASATVPEAGRWRVYVRTRKWVDGAGFFKVLVDGNPLGRTFGAGSDKWEWEDGGEVELKAGRVSIALRDMDGFDGRCAGVVLVKGETAPKGALSVTDKPSEADYDCDFVVVGGGLAGCCAAVSAARAGIRTALVQDRPVPGGNASGEIRVWSAGEIRYPLVKELRGKFMNMRYENAFSDQDRIAFLEREPNLSCFYWHRAFGVEKDGERIAAVKALDVMANRVVRFRAPRFCDATGDGWVGFWAGADWRYGREGKDETGETYAPEKGDRMTLGSSIMWESATATYDVPFSAPWAEPYACGLVKTGGDWNWEFGLRQDIISDGEQVRDRVLLAIYGAFSNAKKLPENAHRKLVTCPFVLGKRETRRLMGDHVFCEQDITEKRQFDDAVATGSWSIDLHYTIDEKVPFLTRCEQPHYGRYWIPYRSLYSRNVPNLFMAGRCFSCTHVGLGSPRVMNTLAQLGCAVGEAAAMCAKGSYSPRELYMKGHARELQVRLGGAFPGHPDPSQEGWQFVDDEDGNVTFEGGWHLGWNCNGGQLGDRTHYAVAKEARAIYPLPVKKAGRYRLKGLVPHLFNYSFAPVVRLTVKSGERSTELEWNQLVGSGEWQDLAVIDLVPGATLTVSEGPMQDPVYGSPWVGAYAADGFAIVQGGGE